MCLYKYSNLLLLITVITILISSAFGGKGKEYHVNVEEYHTCIPITFRPFHTRVAPSQEIHISGETLRATRHHIIPFSTLRDFINLVLRENPRMIGLGAYLAINIREIFRYFEENPDAGAYQSSRTNTPTVLFLHGSTPITFLGRRRASFEVDHRMLAAFTWIPGNLFYGPSPDRRAYDPGDQFDEDAEIIVGEEAFAVLKRLYQNMHNYINNPSQRTATNFDVILDDIITVATARSRPYEFEARHWSVSGHNSKEQPLFEIYKVVKSNIVIEEITTRATPKKTELKKRSLSVGDGDNLMYRNYNSAAEMVCDEYVQHIKPKFNTTITRVDIEHDVSPLFVYSTKDGHFVYGQNRNTLGWFIKNVDQYGRLGEVSDEGSWKFYYGVQIHYEINGKHYFYGHNLENHYWFIQELTAHGKMGQETSNGFFKFSYRTMLYIQINGQHYLYGQNAVEKNWFLQILNSDGTLGREVSHGTWNRYYDIQFPFKLGDYQYFLQLNTASKNQFIRAINEDRLETMGVTVHRDDLPYSVLFPFSFAGKPYFFGYTTYPHGKKYTIREPYIFGSNIEHDDMPEVLTDAQPFNINGYQYLYARFRGISQWCVFHFDVNYLDD